MRVRIGEKLRFLRGQSSQASIAKLMGVSQPCWQAWETDKREPNITTIRDICRKMNCSADWLLGVEVPPPTQVVAENSIIATGDSTAKPEARVIDCTKCDLMRAAIKAVQKL